MAGVNYFTVGSNDLERAKAFYDDLLGSIGMRAIFEHPSGGRLYSGKGLGMFGVLGPYDGNPANVGNGSMGGFRFETAEELAAFHARALALGGKNEGDPGPRAPKTHFAYFRDPDGNKLCGYFFG
jgi:catechol 2,3-dioxygenase-like lactoylglutathione lyase family enzyme